MVKPNIEPIPGLLPCNTKHCRGDLFLHIPIKNKLIKLLQNVSWNKLSGDSSKCKIFFKIKGPPCSVQFSHSVLSDSLRPPWIIARQPSLSITNSQSLLKLMSIESVMPSHPLLSPSPPAPNPSQHQGLFQLVNSSHEVAKVLEFQLQHHSFQWTPRTDLLQDGLVDLLAVQGTRKSLLQHHSSKASIFRCSAFFTSIHDHWKDHSFD